MLICLISPQCFAQIPSGYYSTATGSGYTLKTQLHDIIDGHTVVSYSAIWTHYANTDIDASDGFIWDMYSENPTGTDPYNYTLSTDQCGNYSGEGSCYNREHSFPKSWFNDGSPMLTDIHHVVPTDGYVNGQRSNHPFGEVGSATFTSQNGSKRGSSSISGYSGTVFEPIDAYKGDFARIYFYMATRYEDVLSSWSADMLDGSTDQVFTIWALDMLIDWHNNDPVDQKEIDRNDEIYYGVQGNRNPFVDHPEYVGAIWGSTSCSGVPSTQVSGLSVTNLRDTQATIPWTSGDGSNRLVVVKQGSAVNFTPSNSTTYTGVSSDFSSATDQGSENYIVYNGTGGTVSVTGLTAETTYHVQVFEFCSDSPNYNTTNAPTTSFTTSATPSVINSEDFTTCGSSTWTAQDEGGTGTWECTSYMSMNGYGDGTSDDWLISPAINLNDYTNETLEFMSRARYNGGAEITVHYSTTYSGTGSPSGFVEISSANYTLPVAGSGSTYSAWTASGQIDISTITGSAVYFAIRYQADGSGAGSEHWEVDDISIQGVNAGSPCVEPTAQPTSLTLTPSLDQVDGSFTASGSADGYLVVQSTASSLGGSPVDGTAYGNGASIGSGTVVTSTSSTSFSSSGLTNGTQYYYFIFAYTDTGCSGGPEYYITSPLSGNTTTTSPPACGEPTAQATSLGLTVVGSAQINGSFTNASGTPDGYLVIASTNASYAGTPSDGTSYSTSQTISDGTVVQSSSSNSFSASGLTASTAYYFYVFAYNSANCTGGPNYYLTTPLSGSETTGAAASSGTLFFQGFESSGSDTWGISAGSSLVSSATGSSDTPSNERIRTGANSWQVNNSSETLTLNTVSTTGYTSMQLDIYLSSTSLSTGNGADGSDNIRVYVDLSGNGYPASPDVTINGNSNARWGYNATQTASTTAGTPLSVSATSGTSTSNYSKIEITIPDGTTSVALQILALNNATNEVWNIDDIELTGTASSCSVNSLTEFSPNTGTEGTIVTILGAGFNSGGGTTAVSFNGTAAMSFNVVSDTEIQAVVASGSGTGQITVTTDACPNTTTQSFTLIENDCPAGGGATDLFFSEYVEGSSNNKYLEIFNGTGSSVDLSDYSIELYSNGNSSTNATLTLSGSLADNSVYTIGHSSGSIYTPDLTNGSVMGFNGDDAIALLNGSTIIDVIGQIGTDPGTQWGSGVTSTANNTIRRMSSISAGDSDGSNAFDPSTEWDGYAEDNVADLGSHTFSAGNSHPVITVEPGDQNECNLATFSVTATGTVDTYQWRYFDGTSWTNVTDGGIYSGATTNTLTVTGFSAAIDNYQFYCELVETGQCTNVTRASQLTVFGSAGTLGEWSGGTSGDWTDCKNWSDGTIPTSTTNITIPNIGTSPSVSSDLTINNLTVNTGATLLISGATTLTVNGDLSLASGASIDGDHVDSNVTLAGSLNNLTLQGTLQPNTDLNIASGAEIALSATADFPNESNDLTVTSGGILNFNGFDVTGTSGDFFVNSGGAIKITSADGITSSGASGNVQTDARTFDTSADYYFIGSETQSSGNAFPATVDDLFIEKSGGSVTLTNTVSVSGDVTISGSGNLVTGSNQITLGSTSMVTGEDADSYIDGTVGITTSIDNETVTPGNLGVSLTTSDNLGSTVISRVTGANGIINAGSYQGIASTWSITPTTQPSSAVTGSFEWLSVLDNSIDLGNLEVWHNSGSGWELLQNTANGGSGNLRSVVFSTTSFSDFTITDNDDPLPVTWLDFQVEQSVAGNNLTWSTGSELNNQGFHIMKSWNGSDFESIGFVNGNGTTSKKSDYSFMDDSKTCEVFYALKQVDFDGAEDMSQLIYLTCQETDGMITVFPNPVSKGKLELRFDSSFNPESQAEAVLHSISGQEMMRYIGNLGKLGTRINAGLQSISKGLYHLKIKTNGGSHSFKIVIE